LREESIARVDRLRAGVLGGSDDVRADEVGLSRRRRSDANGFVGEANVARIRVGVGIDRHGRDAHTPRRLDDAPRDLAAVGDQDLGEHRTIVSSASWLFLIASSWLTRHGSGGALLRSMSPDRRLTPPISS